MKKLIYLSFLLLVSSCSDSNDPPVVDLEFVYLSSLDDTPDKLLIEPNAYSAAEMISSAEFVLSDVPGTKNYYFIIKNNSEVATSNVELFFLSELDGVTLNKTFFEEIPPFEDLGLDEVLSDYTVKLTITHGISPNGDDSIAPLQPMGEHSITLRASNLETSVESVVSFKVLLADLKAFDENGEINLANPTSSVWAGGFEAGGFYSLFRAGVNAKVVNSGNVDLPIQIFNNFIVLPVIDTVLTPGVEYEVLGDRTVTIAIKEASAVRDYSVFPVMNNRKFYFGLDRN